MAHNRAHHWVPDSFLQAWTDPIRPANYDPFVHLFDKTGRKLKPRSPKNIFNMPDLYTVFAGQERDLSLEQHFSRLEKDFVRVRRLIEKAEYGGSDDVAALYAFTAAMLVRPPHKIDEIAKQWSTVAKMARSIKIDRSKPPLPVMPGPGPSLTLSEVEQMASDPMGSWFPHMLNHTVRALTRMFGCDILINCSPHPFLTSDNPAFMSFLLLPNEERYGLMPRGLASPHCEITIAISPTHALYFTHKSPGVHDWIELDWEKVFEVNYFTMLRAQSTIVADRGDLFFVQTVFDAMAKEKNTS